MSANHPKILYAERVLPGISYFLAGLAIPTISTLIALPFLDELLWLVPTLTYGVYVAIGIGLAPTVSLSDKSLQVGRANISTNLISKASEIPASEAFMERGAKLNPKAYFRFQLGVKGLVKVEINDPADPTPYWLFASRNPDLVVGYLNKKV